MMSDPICEFYSGRDVFVTGGSGLMGKALLEKLLRSCSVLNRIFVLLRERKGKSCDDRLEDIKNSKIFDRIRQEDASALDKLVPISGDITLISLGMSKGSIKLMKNVSLVFHVAATIRFDEPLRSAILLNLRGTREALIFASQLKKLTRFVHISTAYSHPYMSYVNEQIYPAMADWKKVIQMAEKFDGETLDALSHKFLDKFPNTYTFTKHLAEQAVNEYSEKIPVTIIRPSIVHCCGTEPFVGWFDRIIAVMGIIAAVNTGIVRTVYCNPSVILDLVPLDDSTKIFITVPWWILTYENDNKMTVFHVSASRIRSYSIQAMAKVNLDVIPNVAFNKTLWVPNFGLTDNIYNFYFRFYVFHILPGIFLDGLIMLSGREPIMMRIHRHSLASQRAVRFFVFNDYTFETNRLHLFLERLKDYPAFRFDNLINKSVNELTLISVLGSRRYLIKENDESIPQAVRRLKIIKVADLIICKGFQLWLFYYILCKIFL